MLARVNVRFQIIGLLLPATMFVGCGGGQPTGDVIATVPGSGMLTIRGEPLAFHQVIVMPDGERPAVGISDDTGNFTLGTNETGDGVVVGTHPVAISYVGPPNDNPEEGIMEFTAPPPPKVKVDRKYRNPETSGLTVTIPEAGNSLIMIDLE